MCLLLCIMEDCQRDQCQCFCSRAVDHQRLQVPLQPLADNLEAATYATFEADAVKYERYRDALFAALHDLSVADGRHNGSPAQGAAAAAGAGKDAVQGGQSEQVHADGKGSAQAKAASSLGGEPTDAFPSLAEAASKQRPAAHAGAQPPLAPSPTAGTQDGRYTVYVLGAGRGPLVTATLEAAERLQVPVDVTAVEKNASAVVGLRRRLRDPQGGWRGRVQVVAADVRSWQPEQRADIIVRPSPWHSCRIRGSATGASSSR